MSGSSAGRRPNASACGAGPSAPTARRRARARRGGARAGAGAGAGAAGRVALAGRHVRRRDDAQVRAGRRVGHEADRLGQPPEAEVHGEDVGRVAPLHEGLGLPGLERDGIPGIAARAVRQHVLLEVRRLNAKLRDDVVVVAAAVGAALNFQCRRRRREGHLAVRRAVREEFRELRRLRRVISPTSAAFTSKVFVWPSELS